MTNIKTRIKPFYRPPVQTGKTIFRVRIGHELNHHMNKCPAEKQGRLQNTFFTTAQVSNL